MMDIYGAIANGAELHIIPEEIRLDFIALQRYFEENGSYPFLYDYTGGKTVCDGNELRESAISFHRWREACSYGTAEGLLNSLMRMVLQSAQFYNCI